MSIEKNCDSFWDIKPINFDKLSYQLSIYARSFIWNLFKMKVREYLGKTSGEGLKSIEIGCGLGKFSLLMALWGFHPTLLDSNASALHGANMLFGHSGISVKLIEEDAFRIPEYLNGAYDVVTSFGLAEHFIGDKREQIIRNHVKTLRQGGLCFLQVPNALSPCYRFAFGMRKMLGLWPSNVAEVPFNRFELRRIAMDVGLEEITTMSTRSIGADFDYWILNNLRSLLKKLGLYQFPSKGIGVVSSDDLRGFVNEHISHELNWISKTFTYPLVLVGIRRF